MGKTCHVSPGLHSACEPGYQANTEVHQANAEVYQALLLFVTKQGDWEQSCQLSCPPVSRIIL